MLKKKTIVVIVTAGVLALGYGIVSTNAFADNAVGTSATASVQAATMPTPSPSPSVTSTALGVPVSPLATLPTTATVDDGDVQSGSATNGDDDGDVQSGSATNGDDDGENSLTAGVTAGLSLNTDIQAGSNDDNQEGSNSND